MTADKIIARYNRLKGSRGTWEKLWDDVTTFVNPRHGGITTRRTPGSSLMSQVFSCTAIEANGIFAAGLYGHLCAPPWFELAPPNPDALTNDAKVWFSLATRILHDELQNSNFNLAVFEHFKDLGAIGSGCLIIEEGVNSALTFSNLWIGDFLYLENSKGLIDTIYRMIPLTARQAVQEFGLENVGPSVQKAFENDKSKDDVFEFIQEISPVGEWSGKFGDFPFASIYVAVKDKKIVKKSGFYEQPFAADRLDKATNEVYGRGIGIKMLPEIKLLNKMVETTIRAAEKVVDPPLMSPDDGFISPIRTVPGGIIYYRSGTPDRIEPLNTHANIGLGLEMEAKREQAIEQAFFVDLFKLLAERKNMTATEVLERVEEKLLILGPMLGRLQNELFNPLLERCFAICLRKGAIPPPPEGVDVYAIKYTGKLAMAMKQMEVRTSQSAINLLMPWASTDPSILDNFDKDRMARGISERLGMPIEWLRTPRDVEALRKQRQMEVMASQMSEAMPDASKEKLIDQAMEERQ